MSWTPKKSTHHAFHRAVLGEELSCRMAEPAEFTGVYPCPRRCGKAPLSRDLTAKERALLFCLALNYQRTPTLIGITFVSLATLVVPSPFGCVVTAGVKAST